jgi:4-hydroxy-3-methylbut-2-enyl diphosphate reductase
MGLNITKKEKERNVKVELAKVAGFCFGVKRAVEVVYEQVRRYEGQKIYTYGPIIHNEEVVKDLAKQGVEVIHSEEELAQIGEGVVVICSHGVAKRVYDCMEEKGIIYVDATCPFVKKIHDIVAKESEKGSHIVIIGDGAHPEVEGTRGWAGDQADVIQTHEEARQFVHKNESQKLCIVSQTTFNYNKFKDLVEIIEEKGYDIIVLNTICNATKERQEEARRIAGRVDAMVVIGDEHSSNTQKLFEICKNECLNTYYIQTLDDLDMNQLRSVETVGITAGASTPNIIIEEVQNYVRINF